MCQVLKVIEVFLRMLQLLLLSSTLALATGLTYLYADGSRYVGQVRTGGGGGEEEEEEVRRWRRRRRRK